MVRGVSLAAKVTALTVAARVVHFALFLAIGNVYGANVETDTIFLTYAIVSFIGGVAASAVEVSLMPAAHRAEQVQSAAAFILGFRRVVLAIVAGCALVAAAILWFSVARHHRLLVLVLTPIPILLALSSIHAQTLISNERFYRPALAPIFGGAAALALVILGPKSPLTLGGALLTFEILTSSSLWLFARSFLKTQESHSTLPGIIADALRNGAWQAAGSAIAALNPLVAMMFAKQFGAGAITIVDYANRFWAGVPLLFSGALVVFYAGTSRAVASGQFQITAVRRRALELGAIALALTVGLLIVIPFAMDLIYRNGELASSSRLLSLVLSAYVLGTAPYIASLVFVRTASALGAVRLLAISAIFVLGGNIIFAALTTYTVGLAGIGVAWTVVQAAFALFLWRRLAENTISLPVRS